MNCIHWMRGMRTALLLLLVAVAPMGCDSADEEASIEITKTVGKVESGYAFDWAKSDVRAVKRVIVPDTANVQRDASGTDIIVYMQKTLDYTGDVAQPMSIRTLRHRMGLAGRFQNDVLMLATYGEWDAGGDGSARVKVVILVPPELEVTRQSDLSGRSSPANGESAMLRSGPPQPTDDVSAKGWMPLSEKYDVQRRVLQ